MKRKHLITTVFTICAFLPVMGCGGGADIQVEGTVTFKGEPVDGGLILFYPSNVPNAPDKGHADILGGKYAIEDAEELTPGNYRVEILWNKKSGKKVRTPGDPEVLMDATMQVIPPTYNKNSKLTEELTLGSNTKNFDLR